MRFAYQRRGGPLLDWSGPTPPYPSRAGETRSLGEFYPTTHTSNALRRYGGRGPTRGGSAVGYERNRALGSWTGGGGGIGYGGAAYHPAPGMGAFDLPRPGAPEVIEGYEPPQPGDALIHIGGYIPEGAARGYGQQMIGADPPAKQAPFDLGIVRKASVLAAAYHGVKRNHGSILWGLLWAAAAFVSPLHGTLVPAFGVAQGFGQAKAKSNPSTSARTVAATPAARRRREKARKARKASLRRIAARRRRASRR